MDDELVPVAVAKLGRASPCSTRECLADDLGDPFSGFRRG